MPPKHLNFILLCALLSLACHGAYRFIRPAMMVGDAVQLIDQHYIEPIDSDRLMDAAMQGLTASLDENSSFISSSNFGSFQNSINQEFAGIGIVIGYATPENIDDLDEEEIAQLQPQPPVRVITPMVGSPALEAGFLPDDEFMEVAGVDVSALEIAGVSDLLKGPVGTSVDVKVRRNQADLVSLSVQRQTIQLESVVGDHRDPNNDWVYRLQSNPNIAYIRLKSFGEKTVDELEATLLSLNNDFDGLILDLRGNGGGLLYAAVAVCDMFLSEGLIVSTKIRGGITEEEYTATPNTIVHQDIPVSIIIDGDSASASEIVAACLQDHQRATIVGTRSFGKGTVQNILPLQFGRSALRLTVAKYYRPNGRNIHRNRPNPGVGNLQPNTEQIDPDDKEWGVSPNEGMEVTLDDEALKAISLQWNEASYPLLKSSGDLEKSTDSELEPGSERTEESDQEFVDPQLKRAVSHLHEIIRGEAVLLD